MNKLIADIMHQCYIAHSQDRYDMEKFAELIVQECMTICNETQAEYTTAQLSVYEFSEKNIHANGASACERVRNKIKRRFGVE